jgi:hypothetical protein
MNEKIIRLRNKKWSLRNSLNTIKKKERRSQILELHNRFFKLSKVKKI